MTDLPIFNAAAIAVCQCGDDEAAQVASLMLRGFTQREASLLVWGTPGIDSTRAVWTEWVARQVAEATAGLRAAVGLS